MYALYHQTTHPRLAMLLVLLSTVPCEPLAMANITLHWIILVSSASSCRAKASKEGGRDGRTKALSEAVCYSSYPRCPSWCRQL